MKDIIKFLVAILPSILIVWLLLELYPYTGLGRIIALPMIFIINTAIILIAMVSMKSIRKNRHPVIWILIVLLTIIISVGFYPQDGGPHVIKLIWDSVIGY
ncbi:hypothetical protein [Paenibacillus sp. sgz302251]|uniref:hypothetical protein n=1 Tax=Paenibacillus sp. sgz302251 TaxID=3414493 RepID=UPI003C7CEC76